jgi:hypothetical protein
MKKILSAFLLLVATTCFAQENADTAIHEKKTTSLGGPTVMGTVIHNSNQNCSTLVRMIDKVRKDTVYFIPLGNAIKPYDKVGNVVSFKFRRTMIKQPKGCTGVLVMMSDVKLISTSHHKKKSLKSSKPATSN